MIKRLLIMFFLFLAFFLNGQDTITLNTFEVIGIRANKISPITKMTLDRKEIDIVYYSQELPLLLNKTPNVTTSTDGGHNQGYVYFRLRGIDQTRINMTLNGIPLNEPEDQGVYFSNYPGFINSIESMQIQRGVGTSSNGVSSYGGSINFESKQGFDKGTIIQLGYGTFKKDFHNFSYSNKPILLQMISDGFNINTYDFSVENSGSFLIHGGYYGEKNIIKTISFIGASNNGMAWLGVPKPYIQDDPRINMNTDREDDNFKQSIVSLIYTRKISNKSTITSTVYYNRLDGEWDLDLYNLGVDQINYDSIIIYKPLKNYQLKHNFYGLISNFNYRNKKLRIDIGIHINGYNREHSSTIVPYLNKLYVNTGYKNEYSSFVKVQYNANKFLFFGDIQLRYVNFRYVGDMDMNNMDWLFFNPRFGITYLSGENTNVYLSVGTTGREPTRNDIFGGEDNPVEYYNVKPESVIDVESGINYKSKKIDFHGNIYYMDFKNELTHNGIIGENSLPIMTNVEKSFRSGIELDFTWIIYNNNKFIIKYINNTIFSYNIIKDSGRKFMPLYTPNFIMNNMIFIGKGKIYLTVENKLQSRSYIDWENKHFVKGFYTINTSFNWLFYKDLSVNIRFNNITNQMYFTNGYVYDGSDCLYVNPPFNLFLTLKMVFR